MKFGIDIATLGDEFGHPRKVAQLAQAAEAAGWEGLFVWDHLAFAWGVPSGDRWVILTAAASVTEKILLGTAVTPIPRRRPQVLANTLATLDIFSKGRMIFGAGLGGVPGEFSAFGESENAKDRAVLLDEGLEVITRLWSGEPVNFHGACFTVKNVTLAPLPIQRPRIPIWIGGESPPALRRAARWDGWIVGADDETAKMVKSPIQLGDLVTTVLGYCIEKTAYDIAITGVSTPHDGALAREYADAGVTWWLESIHGMRGSFDEMLIRVKAGPPQ